MHGKDIDPATPQGEPGNRSRRTTPPESVTPRTIDPFPFEPAHDTPSARPSRYGAAVGLLAAAFLALLLFSLWFVFTARQLRLDIQPEPDRVDVQGALLTPQLRGYYLLQPGTYRLLAVKTGYTPLETDLVVADQDRQTLSLTMEKLPGRLDITAHEADRPDTVVDQARVLIDRTDVGTTPLEDLQVAAGEHHLRIEADLYRPLETPLTVEGMDRRQRLSYALIPHYAQVTMASDPPEAVILVDGVRQGLTPATLPMAAGQRHLELRHPGYKPWTQTVPIDAGPPVTLETAVLDPLDGRLAIDSQPKGANVMVGRQYRGQTPLTVDLPPDISHKIQLSKSGYAPASREITLTSGEETALRIDLAPRKGIVHLRGAPQGASLWVDGRPHGPVPEQLSLLAVPHRLEIRKEGFTPVIHRVTPRPGYPIELSARLKRTNATEVPGVIRAPNGYRLQLIRPARFQMGASRREQGRRANETLRLILLTRPFFMGLREVSNREFRAFDPGHDSGSFKGTPLNLDDQPVVQVTWEQAARYCNWLSLQEGLAPVYRETNGTLRPVDPMGNGYRLPTEAEWEFCARYGTADRGWKYPWGTTYPPPSKSVNIADASAARLMNLVVEKYDDTFPAAAPVGSFPPNPDGLFDLGGNVAEWCHDVYSIYPARPGVVETDPRGPAEGQHHVIRGSSWQDASIRTLRAAYRDYQDEARPDLGFRICRYAEAAGSAP
jgi:formylglycine-generating enzyme required for sulfatase activity